MSVLIDFLIVLVVVTFWVIGLKEYFDSKREKQSKIESSKKSKKK